MMAAVADDLDPAAALRRIAYLLEAARAETYRVRALRRAADTVAAAGPDRLRALAGAGRLTDLAGVGATTAAVVAEALAGVVPSYLRQLEAEQHAQGDRSPLEPAAAALLGRLQGDLHSHSDWSDGGSPVAEMAEAAAGLGHRYLALTDHSPRLTVAHGLDADRLRRQLAVVAEVNERLAPFRLLSGIEVDILVDGTLDQDEALLAELDVVVASVHSKLRMPADEMTARMLTAVESPHTDVLGHCTGRLVVGRGRPASAFDAEAVFGACARTGTAVEVNCRPERLDPPPDLLRRAVGAGCLLSLDTDAHAPGQLEWQANGCRMAAAAGADPEQVVNTWDVDRLLAWTADHGARP